MMARNVSITKICLQEVCCSVDHSGGMEVSLRAPCAKEKPLIPNRIKRDMAGLSQISPELLQWVEKLGKGNFGEVWKCKWISQMALLIALERV